MLRALRAAAAATLLTVGLMVGSYGVSAQTPAPAPSDPPQAQPAPPAPAPTPAPAQPSEPPPAAPPAEQQDAFAAEIDVPARTIVFLKGNANWDSAYDTLVDSFKSVTEFMTRQGLKATGPLMTIYTSTDDTGFQFQAAVPIEKAPESLPKGDIEIGQAPSGRMLKFVHRGSYDGMDMTYEAITNYLDTKQLEAQDTFIEEYVTDPLTTPEDKLVIHVLVPVK